MKGSDKGDSPRDKEKGLRADVELSGSMVATTAKERYVGTGG